MSRVSPTPRTLPTAAALKLPPDGLLCLLTRPIDDDNPTSHEVEVGHFHFDAYAYSNSFMCPTGTVVMTWACGGCLDWPRSMRLEHEGVGVILPDGRSGWVYVSELTALNDAVDVSPTRSGAQPCSN